MKIVCLMVWLAGALSSVTWSQSQLERREQQLLAMPDDTSKVNALNVYSGEIQFADPIKAIQLLEDAVSLATQLKYDYGLSVAYTQRATLYFYETKLDSARVLLDKAYALLIDRSDLNSRKNLALIIQRYAAIHQQRQKYDSAVLLYQQAAELFAAVNEKQKIIYCYYNLSTIYNSLNDTDNALQYARETYRIATQVRDSTFILRSYMALADAYVGMKRFDSVYLISRQGLKLATRQGNLFPIGKFHLLLGTYHDHETQYDSSIHHFTAALQSFTTIQLGYEVALTLYHLGHAHLQRKEYNKAVEFLEKGLAKASELKVDQIVRQCLLDLVQAEENLGNVKRSFGYLKQYVAVNDSVLLRNNRKIVYDLETKYQLQKKEDQLALQQTQLRQQNMINYLLAGVVLSILVISFFMYHTFKQKRVVNEQRIQELEREKQLAASESVIKGQEQERGRLARDLHDGLGGLLSGIKFSLTNMKSNVVLDANSALVFERSLDMLDHSIAELRRVANNMMPEVLIKFGLAEALRSYCESIRQSGIFQVDFQVMGMNERLPENTEIIAYRVIQELLNNAAKHAKASYVLVQLVQNSSVLEVTVEDNGSGFEVDMLKTSSGSGWSNIRSRVEYLKGKVDVRSAPGEGTSVHISIPL